MNKSGLYFIILFTLLSLSGCGGVAKSYFGQKSPDEAIHEAKMAVFKAKQEGAEVAAPLQINSATDRLAEAEALRNKNEFFGRNRVDNQIREKSLLATIDAKVAVATIELNRIEDQLYQAKSELSTQQVLKQIYKNQSKEELKRALAEAWAKIKLLEYEQKHLKKVLAETKASIKPLLAEAKPMPPTLVPYASEEGVGFSKIRSTGASINIMLESSASLNPDEEGKPLPIVVRVYQLLDKEQFETADFEVLWKQEIKALGNDLLAKHETILHPDSKTALSIKKDPDAVYLGALAMFRKPSGKKWRELIRLDTSQVKDKDLGIRLLITDVSISMVGFTN